MKQKDSKENNTDLESMIDYIKDRMRSAILISLP